MSEVLEIDGEGLQLTDHELAELRLRCWQVYTAHLASDKMSEVEALVRWCLRPRHVE